MSWKETLASIAPTIATALGGPLAGMAVNMAASSLGIEPSEEAIEKTLATGNPDTLLKLKQLEKDFTLKLEELGVERERISSQDRFSARDLQKETRSKTVPIVAGFTVAGFFGVVGWVLSGHVSLESTLLGFVLGQVSAKAEQVYNYYFGSSAGSKEKTQLLGVKK